MEFGSGERDVTCGSCHTGDLAKHMETGDPSLVKTPADFPPEAGSETCLGCHAQQREVMFWRGSAHQTSNLGCLHCHRIHPTAQQISHPRNLPLRAVKRLGGTDAWSGGPILVKVTEAETCFTCHANIRKAMFQRSTHLFRDEVGFPRLPCYSCHNPHGTQAENLISANSTNEKCYECHQDKRGPFLWEHPPVRENCIVCHAPHGSDNPQLVVLRLPQLCQSCHLQGRHQTVAGRPNAMWNINRKCLNCHTQVHGSNSPSGPILMR